MSSGAGDVLPQAAVLRAFFRAHGYPDEAIDAWLQRPLSVFHGRSALEMIAEGRALEVVEWLAECNVPTCQLPTPAPPLDDVSEYIDDIDML